jgi:hypothetical protein
MIDPLKLQTPPATGGAPEGSPNTSSAIELLLSNCNLMRSIPPHTNFCQQRQALLQVSFFFFFFNNKQHRQP